VRYRVQRIPTMACSAQFFLCRINAGLTDRIGRETVVSKS